MIIGITSVMLQSECNTNNDYKYYTDKGNKRTRGINEHNHHRRAAAPVYWKCKEKEKKKKKQGE